MTTKELIVKLREMPQEAPVFIEVGSLQSTPFLPVQGVESAKEYLVKEVGSVAQKAVIITTDDV